MPISNEDANTITKYFDKKLGQLSVVFPLPSLRKFLSDLPECARKYTVGEILELLNKHYP